MFIVGHLGGKPRRKVFPITRTSGQAVKQIGNYIDTKSFGGNPQRGRVYAADGISPCLNGIGSGGNLEPKVMIIRSVLTPDRAVRSLGNIYPSGGQNGEVYDPKGLSPTLRSGQGVKGRGIGSSNSPKIAVPSHIPGPHDINNTVRAGGRGSLTAKHNYDTIYDGVRIRRLTPLECFRLQGFPDEFFHRAKAAGVSDSQLYKQAGNAVTVTVVYEIAKRLG